MKIKINRAELNKHLEGDKLSVSIIKGKMKPTINIPIIKKPRGMPQ
jgi:hypothetical protein